MTSRRSLWHKVGYAVAIVLLLLPLSYLSQPRTTESPGGKLAQLRDEYQLSQSDLGEIDPTSEALKLATLGMRGIAANLMWTKANECKKTEDWTGFSAALEQITRLQPNFIAVWRFQAWNLSYNISVEFDDYHDRYYWVMKGINFIIGGTHFNRNEPRLLYDVGWFIAQKIGRADEHIQYRKLFREDDDFNGQRKPADRDNWLVGREWFLEAQRVVDYENVPVKGTSPLVFHSYPSMCLVDYSEAIEEEGTYGEVAKNAWRKARESWNAYGDRDIQTTYNVVIHLNDRERFEEKTAETLKQLDELLPGARDIVVTEKIAALPEDYRIAWETPADRRTGNQAALAYGVPDRIKPSPHEIAAKASDDKKLDALRLADVATQSDTAAGIIDRYRQIVNFDYWRLRCEVEQTGDALAARKALYEGDQAMADTFLPTALAKYEEGLAKWRAVFDAYPQLKQEGTVVDELNDSIERYREILGQVGKPFPEDFILKDILKVNTAGKSDAQVDAVQEESTNDVTGGNPTQPRSPKPSSPATEQPQE